MESGCERSTHLDERRLTRQAVDANGGAPAVEPAGHDGSQRLAGGTNQPGGGSADLDLG